MSRMLLLAALLVLTAPLPAGDEDPTDSMSISNELSNVTKSDVTVTISFDVLSEITGWSLAVCDVAELVDPEVSGTAFLDTVNDGSPPFFEAIETDLDDAITIVVLISEKDDVLLATGDNDVYTVSYLLSIGPEDELPFTAPITFCEAGDPIIESTFTIDAEEVTPTLLEGGVIIQAPDPSFAFSLRVEDGFSDTEVEYRPSDTPVEFSLIFGIEQIEEGDLIGSQGVQFGIQHDPDEVENIDDGAEPVGALAALDDGDGPAFLSVSYNEGGTGLTAGCIYSFTDTDVVIEFDGVTDMVRIQYTTVGDFLAKDPDGDSTEIFFSDDLGIPRVENSVTQADSEFAVEFDDLTVGFVNTSPAAYVRGDCNNDDRVDMADGIHTLNAVFRDSEFVDCFDACDSNDDGFRDQTDAIAIFNYRFLDGPAPPAPFPDCGISLRDNDCNEGFDYCD